MCENINDFNSCYACLALGERLVSTTGSVDFRQFDRLVTPKIEHGPGRVAGAMTVFKWVRYFRTVLLGLGVAVLALVVFVALMDRPPQATLIKSIAPTWKTASDDFITSVTWSPTSNQIMVCIESGNCKAVNAETGDISTWEIKEDAGHYDQTGYSPNGTQYYTTGNVHRNLGGINVWNTTNGDLIAMIPPISDGLAHRNGFITKIAIASHSNKVLVGSSSAPQPGQARLAVYNNSNFKLEKILPLRFTDRIAISPYGHIFAAGPASIRFFSLKDGAVKAQIPRWFYPSASLTSFSWSPHGHFFVETFLNLGTITSRRSDGKMMVDPNPWPTASVLGWRLKNGLPMGKPIYLCGSSQSGATELRWRPKHPGEFAVGFGLDRSIRICSMKAKKVIKIPIRSGFPQLSFSPDGNRIAISLGMNLNILSISKHFSE